MWLIKYVSFRFNLSKTGDINLKTLEFQVSRNCVSNPHFLIFFRCQSWYNIIIKNKNYIFRIPGSNCISTMHLMNIPKQNEQPLDHGPIPLPAVVSCPKMFI